MRMTRARASWAMRAISIISRVAPVCEMTMAQSSGVSCAACMSCMCVSVTKWQGMGERRNFW